jgi:hypothetical protein
MWRVCHRVAGVFQLEGKAVVSRSHVRYLIDLIGRRVKDVLDALHEAFHAAVFCLIQYEARVTYRTGASRRWVCWFWKAAGR